jgi:hypothetical protein
MENIGKQYKPERRPLQTECIGRKCMMWVPFEKEGHGNCGLKRRP